MRKVKYARIHDLKVVLPSVGTLPTELPSKNKTLPNLSMTWDGDVLLISVGADQCGIPLANVQFMLFDNTTEVVANASKPKA